MFHILVLLVSWLTWGTVDLINTNAYSVSSSATMIEMTFDEYAHNQGVDDITLTNLIVNGDFSLDSNSDGTADNWSPYHAINRYISNGIQYSYSDRVSLISVLYQGDTIINYYYYVSYIGYGNVVNYTMKVGNSDYVYIGNVEGQRGSSIVKASRTNNGSGFEIGAIVSDLGNVYGIDKIISFNLGLSPIYTQSQLDDIIAYYGYFEGEQTFLNINHIDFDTIYTEFFGTASTVFLDNYDTTAYIDLTTTYNDIDINDIGVMLIFLLGYLTVIHIVKEYL